MTIKAFLDRNFIFGLISGAFSAVGVIAYKMQDTKATIVCFSVAALACVTHAILKEFYE